MADKEKDESKATDLQKRTDVVATEKHPFATKGEKFKIHPTVAKTFLEKGYIEKY